MTGHETDERLAARAEAWLSIALATGPANRAKTEDAVRDAYTLAGLPAPSQLVWYDSPRAGALAAAALTRDGAAGRSVRSDVRTLPWAAARTELTDRLGARGWAHHWAAAGARPWQLIVDSIVTALRVRLTAELAPQLTAEQANVGLVLLDAIHGQHDGAWLPAFIDPASATAHPTHSTDTTHTADTTQAANTTHTGAQLAALAGVAANAGWWWPYERVAILTERPVSVHRDNVGRLHHGDGPAMSYPDGWGLHAWRGMPIPADLAVKLPSLTVAQIRAEPNAEVRRVMLEHFGFDRYLRDSDAREVHRDDCGILWRVNLERDEPLVMVEVVNSTPEPDGTSRTYFLRVPPNMSTAREAVAWTFGLTAAQYAPLAQT